MTTPETTPGAAREAEVSAEATKLTKRAEADAAAKSTFAEALAKGKSREAAAQAALESHRRFTQGKADAAEGRVIEIHPGTSDEKSEHAIVNVRLADGSDANLATIIPNAERVTFVYGSEIAVDPVAGVVTVPRELGPAQLPFLVREVTRLAGRGKNAEVDAELNARKRLNTRTHALAGELPLFDFEDVRSEYRHAEEAHAKTVRRAELALDSLMSDSAKAYKEKTGRDLYKDVGGIEAFRKQLRYKLLDEQDALIYKYDDRGKRYLFGSAAEGAPDPKDLTFGERVRRLWDSTDTVRDFRLLRKLRSIEEERGSRMERLAAGVAGGPNWVGDVGRTFGYTAVILVAGVAVKIAEIPWKAVQWGLDEADDFLHEWQTKFGKMLFGKGYKPGLKPQKERRADEEKAFDQMVDRKTKA